MVRPGWFGLSTVFAFWLCLSVVAYSQDAGDPSPVVDASELSDLANAAKQTKDSSTGNAPAVTQAWTSSRCCCEAERS